MGTITKAQMNTAIVTELSAITDFKLAMDVDDIKEGVQRPDLPAFLVYPKSWQSDAGSTVTQTTFGGGSQVVQPKLFTFMVEVHATLRHEIAQDMARTIDITDQVDTLLDAQVNSGQRPRFGLLDSDGRPAIKSFSWSAEHALQKYGGVETVGAQYTLEFEVF